MSLHKTTIAILGCPVWFEHTYKNPLDGAFQVEMAVNALGSLLEKSAVKEVSRDLSPKVTLVPVPLDLLTALVESSPMSNAGSQRLEKLQANLRQWIDAHVP